MIRYIINEKKPHPLAGMTFTIAKNNEPTAIMIQGKPLDLGKTYFVERMITSLMAATICYFLRKEPPNTTWITSSGTY
jgi:hypothetical protein